MQKICDIWQLYIFCVFNVNTGAFTFLENQFSPSSLYFSDFGQYPQGKPTTFWTLSKLPRQDCRNCEDTILKIKLPAPAAPKTASDRIFRWEKSENCAKVTLSRSGIPAVSPGFFLLGDLLVPLESPPNIGFLENRK